MRLNPRWQDWLLQRRERQLNFVFRGCPKKLFGTALEIGAGTGIQGRLLADYTSTLVCTDFDPSIARNADTAVIAYLVADAEEIDRFFEPASFDLVYSSSVLEHLSDPQRAIAGMSRVLRENGVMVHVVPSKFWKISTLLLYHVYLLTELLTWLTSSRGLRTGVTRAANIRSTEPIASNPGLDIPNNPKTVRSRRPLIRKLLAPEVHGVSDSHLAELRALARSRWRQEFEMAGLRVVSIRPGLVSSGYGFGWTWLRDALERRQVASEYVYVCVKAGQTCPFAEYLT